MLKKIRKKRFIIPLLVILTLGIVWIWFLYRVQITEPMVSNLDQYLDLKVNYSSDSVRYCGNNWLKKNKFGHYELYLEGDDFERGYINGLLTKDLIEKQEIAFKEQIDELIPSSFYQRFLKYMIAWFNRDMDKHIPDAYKREIWGISKSFSPKYDYLGPAYQRVLNYHGAHDIGHMMQNMNFVGCTSFGLWNNSVTDSSMLIGRNFDFYVGDKFAEDKIICFVKPNVGHNFMMVTWGGMIGVVSGMNDKGLSITLNSSKSEIPKSSATPVSIIARDILQHAQTINEAYEIAKTHKAFVSESFMIGSSIDRKAAIIEKSDTKTSLYHTSLTDKILCTNYFQSHEFEQDPVNLQGKQEGASVYRYGRLKELLADSTPFDHLKVASILRDQKGHNNKNIGAGNEGAINQLIAHHSIIFNPHKKIVWVSSNPFQLGAFVAYDLGHIFSTSRKDALVHTNYDEELTISPDTFLYSKDFSSFLYYKKTTKILTSSDYSADLSETEILQYLNANPEYYETYYHLGKWYLKHDQKSMAVNLFHNALTKHLPKSGIKKDIESLIKQNTAK